MSPGVFRQLPGPQRKILFWLLFIIIAAIFLIFWNKFFWGRSIQRLKEASVNFNQEEAVGPAPVSLKQLKDIFREGGEILGGIAERQAALFNPSLTEEENKKLEDWFKEKETRGETITSEKAFEFLEQLRLSGTTTMPSANLKSEIEKVKITE